MSNNNSFWGKRFGGEAIGKGLIFTPKQLGSGPSISGNHQVALEPNSPRAKQSAHDKKEFARRGQPAIVYANGRRVAGPIWHVA